MTKHILERKPYKQNQKDYKVLKWPKVADRVNLFEGDPEQICSKNEFKRKKSIFLSYASNRVDLEDNCVSSRSKVGSAVSMNCAHHGLTKNMFTKIERYPSKNASTLFSDTRKALTTPKNCFREVDIPYESCIDTNTVPINESNSSFAKNKNFLNNEENRTQINNSNNFSISSSLCYTQNEQNLPSQCYTQNEKFLPVFTIPTLIEEKVNRDIAQDIVKGVNDLRLNVSHDDSCCSYTKKEINGSAFSMQNNFQIIKKKVDLNQFAMNSYRANVLSKIDQERKEIEKIPPESLVCASIKPGTKKFKKIPSSSFFKKETHK